MKAIFTNLEITRLAYNEVSLAERFQTSNNSNYQQYQLLKKMQKTVDNCVTEPSQKSIDKILEALNSI